MRVINIPGMCGLLAGIPLYALSTLLQFFLPRGVLPAAIAGSLLIVAVCLVVLCGLLVVRRSAREIRSFMVVVLLVGATLMSTGALELLGAKAFVAVHHSRMNELALQLREEPRISSLLIDHQGILEIDRIPRSQVALLDAFLASRGIDEDLLEDYAKTLKKLELIGFEVGSGYVALLAGGFQGDLTAFLQADGGSIAPGDRLFSREVVFIKPLSSDWSLVATK